MQARRDRGGAAGADLPEPGADDDLRAAWEAEWQRVVFRDALDAVKAEVEPKTFRAFEAYELEGRDVAAVVAELGSPRRRSTCTRRGWSAGRGRWSRRRPSDEMPDRRPTGAADPRAG